MAFRSVATPARVGLAPTVADHDFSAVAGPFRDGRGHPRFLLGKYEVNGLQVAAVEAYAKSSDCPSPQLPDGRLAASTIGWQEAMTFGDDWTGWLLAQGQAIPDCTGGAGSCLPRADSGPVVVRLPTEDEWVFAARGGLAVTPGVFAQARYPMPDGIDHYAWSKDNAGGQVHPIGTRAAGPFGLHDLYGNVSEMLVERTFTPTRRGQAPAFVIRGGARYDPSEKLSADLRYEVPIHSETGRTRTSDTGFRVVVSLAPANPGSRAIPIGAPGNAPAPPTDHTNVSTQTQDLPADTALREATAPSLIDRFGIAVITVGVALAIGVGVGIATGVGWLFAWFGKRHAAVRRREAALRQEVAERQTEAEATRQAEAQAKRQAEAEEKRQAAAEENRHVEAEARRQAEAEAEAKAEAKRQVDAEATRRAESDAMPQMLGLRLAQDL